jgi:hypothetical protein
MPDRRYFAQVRRVTLAREWRCLILSALTAALAAPALFGQATEGSILGTVIDPSGGVIAGAHIQLTGVETGAHSRARFRTQAANT